MKLKFALVVLCLVATLANCSSENIFLKLTSKQFSSSDVFPLVQTESHLDYNQLVYGQQAYNITYKGPPHGYTFHSSQTLSQLTFYTDSDFLVARDQTDVFLVDIKNVGKQFQMSKFEDSHEEYLYVIRVNVTATLTSRVQKISVYNSPENTQFYYFFLENKQVLFGQVIHQSKQNYSIEKLEKAPSDFVDLINDTLFYKTYYLAKTTTNGKVEETKTPYPLNKSVKNVCFSAQKVLTFITDQDEIYQGFNQILGLPSLPIIEMQPGKNSTLALLYKDKAIVINSYQTTEKDSAFQLTTISIQKAEQGTYSRISLANIKGPYTENYKVILNTNNKYIDQSSVDFFVQNNYQSI